MTEEEARKKWCPMVRFGDGNASGNRFDMHPDATEEEHGTPLNPKACRCIASDCTMWVWDRTDTPYGFESGKDADGKETLTCVESPIDGIHGCCGLIKG